jgi:glycosyltransferase involved in cell wall biosynthesis
MVRSYSKSKNREFVKPLVSIIIPTYNRANIISETLDSVLEQTYQNWECIVVDDGSTDDTLEIIINFIKLDNRFQFYNRPESKLKGPSSCRNYGIDNSKGEYIIFLDSDDLFSKCCLQDRVYFLSCNTDFIGAIFCTQQFVEKKLSLGNIYNWDTAHRTKEDYLSIFLRQEYPWTIMSGIWHKNIFKEVKFNENLLLLEDVAFHIDVLFLSHFSLGTVQKIDNYYRMSKNNKHLEAGRFKKIFTSYTYILNKHIDNILLNPQLTKSFKIFHKKMYFGLLTSDFTVISKFKNLSIFDVKDLITKKERFLITLLSVLYITKLNHLKNIGIYSIITRLNKSIFK